MVVCSWFFPCRSVYHFGQEQNVSTASCLIVLIRLMMDFMMWQRYCYKNDFYGNIVVSVKMTTLLTLGEPHHHVHSDKHVVMVRKQSWCLKKTRLETGNKQHSPVLKSDVCSTHPSTLSSSLHGLCQTLIMSPYFLFLAPHNHYDHYRAMSLEHKRMLFWGTCWNFFILSITFILNTVACSGH